MNSTPGGKYSDLSELLQIFYSWQIYIFLDTKRIINEYLNWIHKTVNQRKSKKNIV